ncbi:cytosolic phospholipase A2 epsilon-like [Crotalus adamanteus]|uniref:Cytosolic phospholipase A2 epsilon-like n=1 Tax=Crotalus adamanteus TaxID=8729 RepID=A0AAW1C6H3_CROAD
MFVPPGDLATKLRGALTDRLAVAQYHNFLKGFQMHDSYIENTHFHRWKGEKRSEANMAGGNIDVSSCKTPYSTYCLQYSDEDFDKLVNLSEYNILNNQHLIFQALHAAIERKRQHCCKN